MNKLVTSASTGGPRDGILRDDLPQFAFAGRSNVGKSSLLNALMRQRLARTSAAAGKTRQANIYLTTMKGGHGHPGDWNAYLVDLPGYGYARGGHESVRELATVVDAYLAAAHPPSSGGPGAPMSERRGAIFLLVDSRHPGIASDLEAWRGISAVAVPPRIIATKIDKLSRRELAANVREFERLFSQTPVPVSSTTGDGLNELRRIMASLARGVDPD